MTDTYDAVVAGHLCLDIIPQLSGIPSGEFMRLFVPGRLVEVGPAALMTGGPVSNTGLALHKLGIATRLMGKVGADLFGQTVGQIVASFGPGLADGMVIDPTVSTSYTVVVNPPGTDRMFLHCPGANDTFGAADVRHDVVAAARLFHFGYPPLMRLMYADGGIQLSEVFRRARSTGVTTSLDMAFPDPSSAAGRADWPAIIRLTLPYVDVFLPSVEEILFTLRRPAYEKLRRSAPDGDILPLITPQLLTDLSDELLALGVKIVGLKQGYRGLYLRTADRQTLEGMGRARPSNLAAWADRELWTACFQVDVVGTAGSGDATIAGFLAALLRDMTAEEAVTAAVAVGACNVEAADTLSGIRPWDETLRRIAAGWPKHPLDLAEPDWQYDAGHWLWRNDRER